MPKLLFILLSGVFTFVALGVDLPAQENPLFERLETVSVFSRPPRDTMPARSSLIKEIQRFSEKSGVAFTNDALFRTDDKGENWREIILPREVGETISGVSFDEKNIGWVILADQNKSSLALAKTTDGGINWTRLPINLKSEHLQEANFDKVELIFSGEPDDRHEVAGLKIHLASNSNFLREVYYMTLDGGQNWGYSSESASIKHKEYESFETVDDKNVIASDWFGDSRWFLTSDGFCEGFKTGCWQETKLYVSEKEITPPQIKELAEREKTNAKLQAENSVFAQPPGGTTRFSLNRGFDKCTAATASQMQTWWNTSPFYDANIYISGRNRGCTQPQLTAAWVSAVSAQGWGLIPTIVGYQSPCSVCTTCQKHSTDALTAEQQGRGEADIAIADANNLGLTQGTVLYYDMERYDDVSGTGACSTPTKAFLKGWTDRLKETGYISGVYGSPTNAVGDWLNIPEASRMDAVWLARWDNIPSVWTYASPSPVVPETAWGNHQRIKQWQAPHNETWGGVTFNIDGNIADGPVAGAAIAKNKRADFDGDGRTDVSVWRPDAGVWHVTNSSNSSYTALSFGLSTDLLVPGDYDGDGKTDFAVWRPETGVWHVYSRSIYRSFTFGTSGDIPAPADYDGDGRTDLAVFRPSTGVWYIRNSFDSRGTSYTIVQFGASGDKPVADDYDGDGRADIAVFRPSSGEWWLNRSTDGVIAAAFGGSTDQPVQADYSGDGRADLAFWRSSTGEWFILRSEDASYYSVPFGLTGDIPAVGDYDGDGQADPAVFRPDTGVWYVSQSQAGVLITQFGQAADKPVPSAYTP